MKVPMWIYVSLDIIAWHVKPDEGTSTIIFWRESFKRMLVAGSLFIPSLIDYCAVVYFSNWTLLVEFHYVIGNAQLISIIGSLLILVFDCGTDNKLRSGSLEPKFVERHTTAILCSFSAANILTYAKIASSKNKAANQAFIILIAAFFLLGKSIDMQYRMQIAMYRYAYTFPGALELLYLGFSALFTLSKNLAFGRFSSDKPMFDFFHLLALALYCFAVLLIYSIERTYGITYDTSPSCITALVIVRIFLTVALKVIPTRCYKLSSALKQEALENRLNLIRYLSHEMRTPLNTVFIGLDYIISEMKRMKDDLTSPLYEYPFEQSLVTMLEPSEHSEHAWRIAPTHAPVYVSSLMSSKGRAEATNSLKQINDVLSTSQHVLDSCHIALETLNDLLTLDKIDDGKFILTTTKFNPFHWVKSCAGPFALNARDKSIKFNLTCFDRTVPQCDSSSNHFDSYSVWVDEFKINQVLRNLLSNAIKFTPQGGTVEMCTEVLPFDKVTCKVSDRANPEVPFQLILRVSVKDNGPGISIEDQKKLFGKYVQFNAGALQSGKGSGLGLWISRSEI